MFQLGMITDEVSQNLKEVAAFCRDFDLSHVELRSVEGKGPFEWRDADADHIRRFTQDQGLSVVALSSPLFKCDIGNEAAIAAQIDSFDRLSDYACAFGCKIIRGFDFWACGASPLRRAEKYQKIIELCEKKDLTCALEYDPSVHASTPGLLKELLDTIHHPRIRALFDPGNGIFSAPDSQPYPDDYELLKNDLCHIHVKDAKIINGKVDAVRVGDGWVNYPGLIQKLIQDDYSGYLMLETHYRLTSLLTEEQLKLPGGNAFSLGGEPASRESMKRLKEIIANAQ